VKIGKYEDSIGGTSANLQRGQIYTVAQLLYGLMLPSGNDASLALAVWCGKKLLLAERNQRNLE
jgi:D-alanyl-D-alanine carboxypeptidase (penicillin-binding protein 5/6)